MVGVEARQHELVNELHNKVLAGRQYRAERAAAEDSKRHEIYVDLEERTRAAAK
jgi:hypothetical protein